MERIGRPIVILVLVVLLAAAGGTAYLRLRDDRIPLGDKGRVTATVVEGCRTIAIEVDDLDLSGSGDAIEPGWRGRPIEGTLVLDEHLGKEGVAGTFTADSGGTVEVTGGGDGYLSMMECAIWGGG